MKKNETFLSARRKEALTGYLFASPWIIGFLVFTLFPILASFYLSFTFYDSVSKPYWNNFGNFRVMLNEPLFFKSLGNTLYYVMLSVPINIILGVLMGLLINQKVRGIRLARTIFYLPNVLSVVAVSFLWQWLFNPTFGPINLLLSLVGLEGPSWLADESWTKPAMILMSAWGVGGSVIIFLAAIKDVSVSLYEAADIDGAGAISKFRRITLPSISPTIYFNFIMGIIGSFQVFLQSYIMLGRDGGVNNSSLFYAQLIYNKFSENQMGLASALSWVLLVIVLIITILAMKLSNKLVFYLDGQT